MVIVDFILDLILDLYSFLFKAREGKCTQVLNTDTKEAFTLAV